MNRHSPVQGYPPDLLRVVLRQQRDADGTRYLEAYYAPSGDIVIEGQDLGKGVEDFFGFSEYEWVWTIKAADIPQLLNALEIEANPLRALGQRFSGAQAAGLSSFLDGQQVPYSAWSRIGD